MKKLIVHSTEMLIRRVYACECLRNRFVGTERAKRTLSTAQILVDRDPNSAASRAYNAAFHAVTALFALRNKTFRRHTGIRAAVDKELIKTGEWKIDLGKAGKAYNSLFEVREIGEYGGVDQVNSTEAKAAVDRAEMIIGAVKKSCPELLEGD